MDNESKSVYLFEFVSSTKEDNTQLNAFTYIDINTTVADFGTGDQR